MQIRDRAFVHSFFAKELSLHDSADFRGVLYVPDEFRGQQCCMDDVAVAVAYNAFIGKTCCMHSVIKKPETVTRTIVRDTFFFPFAICACEVVLALVDSTNEAALRFDKHLGFEEVHVIKGGGIDGDLIILEMHKDQCRWIKGKIRKSYQSQSQPLIAA